MKRITLTLAIILGISLAGMAQQQGGGLFGRGAVNEETSNDYNTRNSGLMLPTSHGSDTDTNGTPVGSGLLLLVGLSGAYLTLKKKEDKA